MRTRAVRSGLTVLLVLVVSMTLVGAVSANLVGTNFDISNGKLNSATLHDWNPAGNPSTNIGPLQPITCPPAAPGSGDLCGLDRTKSSLDNSFAMGPKEDDPAPAIGTGSIPPNKDDLSRMYVNQEKAGGKDYLFLAWERTNLLGSAHMDFEFNQSTKASTNGVTMERTDGDMLVTFDFGGSGVPILSISRWITTGADSDCEVPSDGLPCWSKLQNLTTGGLADGSVNSAAVNDYNPPVPAIGYRTLQGSTANNGTISSTFGEAAINLTDSDIFPAGKCVHFGAASLKSRSSGQSFTSTLKDFIAPIQVNVTNCGSISIEKQTTPDGATGTFSYTHDVGTNSDPVISSPFTLSDGGKKSFYNLFAGTYHFAESATTGYDFDDITCTVTGGNGSTWSHSGPGLTITLSANDSVACTFTNVQQLGAIKVTKHSVKDAAALSGADFTVVGGDISRTITTGADGTACTDELPWGSYTVTETAAPDHYAIDNPDGVTVEVDHNATCDSGTPDEPAAVFTDSPLSRITVSFESLADGNPTSATIQCTGDADPSDLPEGTPRVLDDLLPGTYTCTVVVDP